MKFIGILLSIILLASCQLKEEQNTDATSDNSASVNIEEFKTLFPTIEWTSDTFHIHHYKWATDENDFEGQVIDQKVLKEYVDSTIFKTNFDEQYYASSYIERLDAFLIRIKISQTDHMQQLFLLAYDADKQAFVSSTKVASCFGAESFINTMASWIVPKEDTYQVFMRNHNWSIDIANKVEIETDSVRTYIFDQHQFTSKSTIKTSEVLKKQFPLED